MKTKTNIVDLLKQASQEVKGKSKVKEIIGGEEVEKYCELAEEVKSKKAEMEIIGEGIKEIANIERGNEKSVRVKGNNGSQVLVSWTSKFCEIPTEEEGNLRDLFGSQYSSLFKTVNTIKIKDTATDKELEEIISLIGEQRFLNLFQVKQVIKPTEEYDERNVKEDIREKVKSLVKQVVVLKAGR